MSYPELTDKQRAEAAVRGVAGTTVFRLRHYARQPIAERMEADELRLKIEEIQAKMDDAADSIDKALFEYTMVTRP